MSFLIFTTACVSLLVSIAAAIASLLAVMFLDPRISQLLEERVTPFKIELISWAIYSPLLGATPYALVCYPGLPLAVAFLLHMIIVGCYFISTLGSNYLEAFLTASIICVILSAPMTVFLVFAGSRS